MRNAGTSRPTLYQCPAVPKGSGDLRVAGYFAWQRRHGALPVGETIAEVRKSAVHLLVRQQMTAAPLPVWHDKLSSLRPQANHVRPRRPKPVKRPAPSRLPRGLSRN